MSVRNILSFDKKLDLSEGTNREKEGSAVSSGTHPPPRAAVELAFGVARPPVSSVSWLAVRSFLPLKPFPPNRASFSPHFLCFPLPIDPLQLPTESCDSLNTTSTSGISDDLKTS